MRNVSRALYLIRATLDKSYFEKSSSILKEETPLFSYPIGQFKEKRQKIGIWGELRYNLVKFASILAASI